MVDVTGEHITYQGPSGPVRAYLAKPEGSGPWPGLVVIHEILGLTPHMEELSRRFASEGYLTVVPDLFCHDDLFSKVKEEFIIPSFRLMGAPDREAAIQALPAHEQQGARDALEWFTKRDQSSYLPDIQASVDLLKDRSDCTGIVGSIGYCMGGALSGRLAAEGADIGAAVIFYGSIPPVDQVGKVRCAVQGHYGGDDHGITDKVPELQAAMAANGKDFTAYVYEGAPHAFFNDTRPSYVPAAAELAWSRTKEFLAKHLKGAAVAK